MGIYDRDYYRQEGPSFLGSLVNTARVCTWLIGINIGVFVAQLATREATPAGWAPGWFTEAFLLNVDAVLGGQVWRLLTYAFLHDTFTIWHIVFNMLFLWWFGSDVELLYGPREFLAFYLVAALLGGIAFVLGRVAGIQPGQLCLGASGAVTAVLVLCAVHYPTRIIYIWFILPVPIWLFVLVSVGMDLMGFLSAIRPDRLFATGTAYTVHLAGAIFAYTYHQLHWRITNLLPEVRAWRRRRARPRLRVFHEEEEPAVPVTPRAPGQEVDEHLEAKLDAVLEKVARHGKNSLTESEHQILLKASEVYKRRRS